MEPKNSSPKNQQRPPRGPGLPRENVAHFNPKHTIATPDTIHHPTLGPIFHHP